MTEDDTQSVESGPPHQSRKRFLSVTIEPLLFLVFFAFSISDGVMTNILLSRTCRVVYHLPEAKCSGHLAPDVEELVQPYTTKITMFKSLVEAIVSGVLVMFVGPWSDRNGRKPFIVFPTAGFALCFIGWYILIALPSANPLWFLLPSAFFTLSGGLMSIFTCIFCYITDITNEKNRAFRMVVISSITSVGIVLGYLSSYFLVTRLGEESAVSLILCLAIGSSLLGLLYAVFLLPESLTIIPQSEPSNDGFFKLSSIREMFESVTRVRPRMGRARLALAIASIAIGIIILNGDSSYKYYALRKGFSWTLEHYNIYSAVACAVSVVVSTGGAYISSSVLKAHELYLALFVALLSAISSVLSALARTSLEFYIFSGVGCMGALLSPMLKTQITRNAARQDLGKIFAFISTTEAFTPLVASPLYRAVYNAVLVHQPLAVFFVSASFFLLIAVLIGIILVIQAFFTRNYHELIINDHCEEGTAQPIDDGVAS